MRCHNVANTPYRHEILNLLRPKMELFATLDDGPAALDARYAFAQTVSTQACAYVHGDETENELGGYPQSRCLVVV